ncbi:MAG TPA: ferritin [Candidatus Merdenecus merdavium]|nr:ferritin [Candidatus Merdenecus merdavium]
MLNTKIAQLLNEQVNYEFYSAYLYLSYSNYYIDAGLEGFANWYTIQAQEERAHAILFLEYLQHNGEKVIFEDIEKPTDILENYLDPLKKSLEHERLVTSKINNIYHEAAAVKDYRTTQFLDWFIKEQGEEEASVDALIKKYELFGTDSKGLYLLDTELAARTYVEPSLTI